MTRCRRAKDRKMIAAKAGGLNFAIDNKKFHMFKQKEFEDPASVSHL